jgi:hypothetical protein
MVENCVSDRTNVEKCDVLNLMRQQLNCIEPNSVVELECFHWRHCDR